MKRSAEGFTLVELVISLAVIAVISIGFFSLFIALVSSATVAKTTFGCGSVSDKPGGIFALASVR